MAAVPLVQKGAKGNQLQGARVPEMHYGFLVPTLPDALECVDNF